MEGSSSFWGRPGYDSHCLLSSPSAFYLQNSKYASFELSQYLLKYHLNHNFAELEHESGVLATSNHLQPIVIRYEFLDWITILLNTFLRVVLARCLISDLTFLLDTDQSTIQLNEWLYIFNLAGVSAFGHSPDRPSEQLLDKSFETTVFRVTVCAIGEYVWNFFFYVFVCGWPAAGFPS